MSRSEPGLIVCRYGVRSLIKAKVYSTDRITSTAFSFLLALGREQLKPSIPSQAMAPSKKKAKTSKTADTCTAAGAAGAPVSSSQSSSKRGASKSVQHQNADHSQAAAVPVSSRPKRNAEKKRYDDSEDDRPQHLSTRRPKKKKGGC